MIDILRHNRIKFSLKFLSYRPKSIMLDGEPLHFDESVSHPRPLPLLHFFKLFRSSSRQVFAHQSVLEMGAGAGVWSWLCLHRKAHVTATDLKEVSLRGLQDSAYQAGFNNLDIYYGDLFENITKRSFDHIFFNPPFHFATPTR